MDNVSRREVLKLAGAAVAAAGVGAAAARAGEKAAEKGDKAHEEEAVVPFAKAFSQATWTVSYTWDGASGSTQVTFKDDGTFVTGDGYHGRWFQIGKFAVWAFENSPPAWSVVYSSTVNDTGTGFSGIQGWSSTSGHPKGTHSAFRSAQMVEDVKELKKEGVPSSGEKAKGDTK